MDTPLEQIIQRMTQNPAQRFGLKKRGEIKEGYFADLVLFDADNVIDRGELRKTRSSRRKEYRSC